MRKFVLLLGCFAASPLAAEETRLTGEAIKTTLSGSVLALDTPVGSTVTVRIGHDSMMSGDAGTALGTVLGAAKDRGRWWVVNDQVCFKWFRWFDAEQRCATIRLDGKHLTWQRDDGDSGTATIVEQSKPAKPSVILAETEKKPTPPAHKPAEKKIEDLIAANASEADVTPKSEAKLPEATPKLPAREKSEVASAIAAASSEATVVAFHVPPPRLAVRPERHEKIAVASVRPQFFAAKLQKTKTQPTKVTPPAKVAQATKAALPKTDQKPFRVAGVDPTDVLNIRNGPSSDYQSVGTISPDSHGITITGPCQNDWCPVKHRKLVGWVNRKYLAEETAANTAAVSEPNYWDPEP